MLKFSQVISEYSVQMGLLLWKKWLMRMRHYVVTIFEIMLPLSLCITLTFIRSSTVEENGLTESDGKPVIMPESQPLPFDPLEHHNKIQIIHYFPQTNYTQAIMENVQQIFLNRIKRTVKIEPLQNEEDINEIAMKSHSWQSITAAIVFPNDPDAASPPSRVYRYKIRLQSTFPGHDAIHPIIMQHGPQRTDGGYKDSGFYVLQRLVNMAHFKMLWNNETQIISPDQQIMLQGFPFPKYVKKKSGPTFITFVPNFIVYGLIVMSPLIVKRVVEEKCSGAKEMMRLMGMKDMLYWFATFLDNFFVLLIISFFVTLLFGIPFKGGAILANSDRLLFFCFMLLYSAAYIMFSLAFTPFFNKPELAVVVNTMTFLGITYMLPLHTMDALGDESKVHLYSNRARLATCLLPNMALNWFCKTVAAYEETGNGAVWPELFISPSPGECLSIGSIMVVMLASILLYGIILWYFDATWPWQKGIPKPFNFPFMKSYWIQSNLLDHEEIFQRKANDYFEDDPQGLPVGIRLINLTKVYGSKDASKGALAVDKISLNIYHGQITVLLGHNGAGKTTTMNMITGMFHPTSGMVRVNGFDIIKQTTEARRSIGLCPQHNGLYEDLTVREHLKFFAGLKGCSPNSLKHHMDETLEMVELTDKKHELVQNLSGGMKRRLSLGIAYIGGSKVLILDEPTSGMDPQGRRAVWDILLRIRPYCTILLTTQYMEEADILGDRIAIMANGVIQCCGSPLFLKTKFGAGYQLRIAKDMHCDVDSITQIVQKHVPQSVIQNNINTEVCYSLTMHCSKHLSELFEDLENEMDTLGIAACGVSVMSMEDVFLQVNQLTEEETGDEDEITENEINLYEPSEVDIVNATRARGTCLALLQIKGLLAKRFYYARCHCFFLAFQVMLPVWMWSLLLVVDGLLRAPIMDPGLKVNLSLFKSSKSFYMLNSEISEVQDLAENYYAKLLNKITKDTERTVNATAYLLKIAEDDLQVYRHEYLVGASFGNGKKPYIRAWFNGEAYHTAAVSINILDTAILQMLSGNANSQLEVVNQPLAKDIQDALNSDMRTLYATLVSFVLAFLSPCYIMFPVHERVSKAKLLQLMSGLDVTVFWGVTFLWDLSIHLIICFVMAVITPILDWNGLFQEGTKLLAGAIVLFLLFGWCSIPLCYILSLVFKNPGSAFSFVCFFNLITGMLSGAAMVFLKETAFESHQSLLSFMRLLPSFTVTWDVTNILSIGGSVITCRRLKRKILNTACKNESHAEKLKLKMCCKEFCGDQCAGTPSPFSWSVDGAAGDMLMLLIGGIAFLSVLCFVETHLSWVWYSIKTVIRKMQKPDSATEVITIQDSDVIAERERVEQILQEGNVDEEALIVHNLTKRFRTVTAVNHLTFSVKKNECFGLLGVNGSGKTSTFRMLTGDLILTEGNAYIGKYSIHNNLKKFQTHIGYCPQYDPFLKELTGREMLYLFGRLRGVTEDKLSNIVNFLINMVDLKMHADKRTQNYSGGNRRKLSVALTLIGSPPIVFLDEPTSGVDPKARRKIWATLVQAKDVFNTSIVLTSHSMEECEALCSRITIMVKGEFQCLGTTQYLRSKYGQGFTIIAKVKQELRGNEDEMRKVRNFIEATFPSAELRDSHQGMLYYHIVDKSRPWSWVFQMMEHGKKQFGLQEYLVSDTTLEQIFLMFARKQCDERKNFKQFV